MNNSSKRMLSESEIQVVSGGDRWGDGRDDKNHPDPNEISQVCDPMPAGHQGEICIIVRYKKVN